jgi:hypothetical protein
MLNKNNVLDGCGDIGDIGDNGHNGDNGDKEKDGSGEVLSEYSVMQDVIRFLWGKRDQCYIFENIFA